MQVNITARHLELTPALVDYVKKKVEKCERYFDHLVWAQVILSVEKYRQVAEVIIHAGKTTLRSKDESIDMYAAIDLSIDKMEKQLHKYKEISKTKRRAGGAVPVPGRSLKRAKEISFDEAETGKYLVSEVRRFSIRPISAREAIDAMELLGYKFFMFMNADTSQINVVYQKENGSYGMLEPEL